jgi:predicted nucleotidyltransferase
MNDIHTITKTLHDYTPQFARDYAVRRFGVFGSMVRGDQTESSDIDILVDFTKPIGLFAFVRLEEELTKLLKRKVDLVTSRALKSAIRDDILKETLYV